MKWRISVRNGVANKTDLIDNHIAHLRDGDYFVEIEKVRAKRSGAQNAFYHGVILPLICEWMGEVDTESVCKSLKVKLGYCQIKANKLGQKIYDCPSSAVWDKGQMSDFLFKIEALMSEMTDGVFIFPRGDENNPY